VPAERVAPGVFRVLKGFVNAYALQAEDGITLIDCGPPKRGAGRIADLLRALGSSPADVRNILVTHCHIDHIGGLASLAATSGASVLVHGADAPVVRGETVTPGPNRGKVLGRVLGPVLLRRGRRRADPVTIERELADGEVLPIAGGLRVIHTPGHTPGQISFLADRDGGILITGDAAGSAGGRPYPPIGPFLGVSTEDLGEAVRSFRKLAELDFEVAAFGHGRPLTSRAAERFRAQLGRLPE
jgi:glyoxylase-like metal-dependent hydrolase (beta-lactamase superfamily II)